MNWVAPVAGAATAVLVALIVAPLIRQIETNSGWHRVIYVFLFLIAWGIASPSIKPPIDRFILVHKLEGELLENVAYAALKEYEPDTYKRVLAKMKADIQAGANAHEAYAEIGREFGAVLGKRLPSTSNQAALAFMKVRAGMTKQLMDQGGDTCYLVLHQKLVQYQAETYSRFTPALKEAAYAAMAQVIRDARLEPMTPVTDAEIIEIGFVDSPQLSPELWIDVGNLHTPKATLALRRRDCEVWLALYAAVFKLPEDRAGAFVRY
ncbi:hypothetical protein [Variovorax paradoxus]|uniref:hypothetical protein n=1 Tax=Variovorax paradoxus TaxID=34073 RepID=UPI003D65B59A